MAIRTFPCIKKFEIIASFIAGVSPCSVMLHHIKTGILAPVFLIRLPYMDQLDD